MFLRTRHRVAVPLVVAALVASSCAGTNEVDVNAVGGDAGTDQSSRDWLNEGFALAAEMQRRSGGRSIELTLNGDGGSTSSGSPSSTAIVTALTAAGLPEDQAECIAGGLENNPAVADDVLSAFTAIDPNASPEVALATLAADESTLTSMLLVLTPCLDAGTVSLLGGLSSAGELDPATLLALASSGDLDPTLLAGVDVAGLAAAAGGNLSPAELAALQSYLATGNLGALAGVDLSQLDLSALTPQQAPLLLLALLSGLSNQQVGQLTQLANIQLDQLELGIDASELTPEQLGALVLLISPIAAAGVSSTGGVPPAGADPNQIYIPAGADLSQINPLTFINRDDLTAQAERDGTDPATAGCLYDNLRAIDPGTLASIFANQGNPLAVGQVLVAAIECVLAPGG